MTLRAKLVNLAYALPVILTTMYISYIAITTYLKDVLNYRCTDICALMYSSATPVTLLATSVILGAGASALYTDLAWGKGRGRALLALILIASGATNLTYATVVSAVRNPASFVTYVTSLWFALGFLLGNLLTNAGLLARHYYSVSRRGTLVGTGVTLGVILYLTLRVLSYDIVRLSVIASVLAVACALLVVSLGKLPKFSIEEGVSLYDIKILAFLIPLYIFFLAHGLIIGSHILPNISSIIAGKLISEAILALPMILSILAGVVMDNLGRKIVGIAGVILLGITSVFMLTIYALIISPIELNIFMLIFSRLSAALIIPYVVVVSAEIAPKKYAGRFLGVCFSIVTCGILSGIVTPMMFRSFYFPTAIVTMALFISIYILYILPETLPPEYLRRREITSYLKKAMKLTGKSKSS
ncbi:MAG: hypothetical protein J7L12_01965 [Desulfurococcales archaeon]|nr:hypothetical protein [Desulfurococcales archaeon]